MAHHSEPSSTLIKPQTELINDAPLSIMKPPTDPLTEILNYFLVGAVFGASWGSYKNYRRGSVMIGGRARDFIIREALRDLITGTLWLGGASGAYAIGNYLSITYRGKSDVYTPSFGGALGGFVLSRCGSFPIYATLLTMFGFAVAGRLVDGHKYSPQDKDYFYELAQVQERKVRLAYKHALNKADEENYKQTKEFESTIAAYVREKL